MEMGGRMLALYASLERERSEYDAWADKLVQFVMPVSPEGFATPIELSDGVLLRGVTDTEATIACERLAAAHQSHITPSYKVWFSYEASPSLVLSGDQGSEVDAWFARVTEVAAQALNESNFYSATHEVYVDRVGVGTGDLFCDKDAEGRLLFTRVPFKSYVAAEDHSGTVHLVGRKFEFTAQQMVEFFGADRVSAEVAGVYEDETQRYTRRFRLLHMVRKRERWTPGQRLHGRPYESIYVEEGTRHVLEHPDDEFNGFDEFPYCVTRFTKWGSVYGHAPGRRVWSDILKSQRHSRIEDVLAELRAFPRVFKSANMVNSVDFRPAGETVLSEEDARQQLPREWGTVGDWAGCETVLARCHDNIRKAYYTDVLQMFEDEPGNKTATEINARLEDRLVAFGQTFSQFVSDFRPLMQRIFYLLYRMGRFPEPPEVLKRQSAGEYVCYPDGMVMLVEPGVVYNSKFAQMLRELQNSGMQQALGLLGNVVGLGPEGEAVKDLVDFDFVYRKLCRGLAVPEGFFLTAAKVREVRARREEMVKEAMFQQAMGQQGGAGGGMPPVEVQ